MEIRLPFYDPSCVLLITLVTLDETESLSSKPIILGYSFFPLFLNKKAMKSNSNQKKIKIQNMKSNRKKIDKKEEYIQNGKKKQEQKSEQ